MASKQRTKRKKGQRKKFFEVTIPLTATKVFLYAYSPEDLIGKTVKLDMTKSLRGKNAELKASIIIENNELFGVLKSFQILPAYIKRVMRRGIDYVEDSFDAECKDALLRIKPFMITRKRVSRAVRNAIRNTARKHLTSKAKIRTAKELFSEIVTNKLQKELSLKIKKIYPLALCEIRMFQVKEYKETKKESETKPKETEKKTNSAKNKSSETKTSSKTK